MRIFLLALPLLLLGCQSQPGASTTAQTSQSDIAPDRLTNLPYANDPRQALDLFLPKDKKGEPLLIFIHGGAWIGGDKNIFSALGRRFANDGVAVANINYRLSPSVKNPEHVKDAAQAYAWLVQNANEYGYDPKKIYVSGHSAGAHNAAMMATGTFLQDAKVPSAEMPAGFIGMEGIYDIPDLNKKFPSYKNWFFEKAFGDEAQWPSASPSRRKVVLTAPWIVVQSTTDPLVDVPQSEKFVQHLKTSKVKVELWKKDMGNHDRVVQILVDPTNELALEILKFMGVKKG